MKKEIEKIADKLVYAYKKNKLINPIPIKFTKNIEKATKLRKLCESKINTKVVGFKAGGTALPVLKKLKENFNASNGWLYRFKKRTGIALQRSRDDQNGIVSKKTTFVIKKE